MLELAKLAERFAYYENIYLDKNSESALGCSLTKLTKVSNSGQNMTFDSNVSKHVGTLSENNTQNKPEYLTLESLRNYGVPHDYGISHDQSYIDRMLQYKSTSEKDRLIDEYCKSFIKAYMLEKSINKKTNAGRHTANMWLRKASGLFVQVRAFSFKCVNYL